MSIRQNAMDAVIAYLEAHEAWNKAQTDQAAKVRKDKHKALIEAARLYRPQHKPER